MLSKVMFSSVLKSATIQILPFFTPTMNNNSTKICTAITIDLGHKMFSNKYLKLKNKELCI